MSPIPTTATASETTTTSDLPETPEPTAPTATKTAYNRYGNARYGFSCELPANFVAQRAPDNRDGFRYESPDGQAEVVCYGRNPITSTSARHAYEQELVDRRSQGDSVTYHALVGSAFTVSGISSDGKVYFTRVLWGPGSVDTLTWTYPRSLQDRLKSSVERSAATFRLGDLTSAH